MTPEQRGHRPKKRFGQHFLTNGRIADKIVESASLTPDDIVLEIGPGRGVLTERLVEQAGSVYAVEIDRDLADGLHERFDGYPGFHLIGQDILTLNIDDMLQGNPGRLKVVSNIPYNISGPIIELLIRYRRRVACAVLMVQREVARRLLASPGTKDYGLLTLNLALAAVGRKIMDVKPGSFNPPPEVMSTVIALDFTGEYRYPLRDERTFRELTGAAFRQRRKMMRNTVIPWLVSAGIDRTQAEAMLAEAGIDPVTRPETVATESYVRLSNLCASFRDAAGASGDPR